jgi:hypothetical protein
MLAPTAASDKLPDRLHLDPGELAEFPQAPGHPASPGGDKEIKPVGGGNLKHGRDIVVCAREEAAGSER